MFHYVYRITNITINKHYYGVRSSVCIPMNDLGIKYFSSSKDKDFLLDQKTNRQNYKYKIIKTFNSREAAAKFEVKIHNKFNVGINESFYNKCKSHGSKFDTSGMVMPLTDQTKRKISEAMKYKQSGFFNKKHTKESIEKIKIARSKQIISEETRKKISENHPRLSGKDHPMYGKENKYGQQVKSTCPHCGTIGGSGVMKRWHFDNCTKR